MFWAGVVIANRGGLWRGRSILSKLYGVFRVVLWGIRWRVCVWFDVSWVLLVHGSFAQGDVV